MQKHQGRILYNATDLGWEALCSHRTRLRVAELRGLFSPARSEPDAAIALAIRYGQQYELEVVDRLKQQYGPEAVTEVDSGRRTFAELKRAAEETTRHLRARRPVIYQGVLLDGSLVCIPDFIVLVSDGSYEVWDVKWSRSVKTDHRVQIAAYASVLERTLGQPVPIVRILLGDRSEKSLASDDLQDVLTSATTGVNAAINSTRSMPYPDWGIARAEDCARCQYRDHCATGRARDRDLSLVLGMNPTTRRNLIAASIRTVDDLAASTDEMRPKSIEAPTFTKMRAQALIQVMGESGNAPLTINGLGVEIFDPEAMAMLLPDPTPHDVFFDAEGFSFAEHGDGIEYLLGWNTADSGLVRYHFLWGDRQPEAQVNFETFLAQMHQRWTAHPDMHVYHFHHYETQALTKMADRYGVRKRELTDLVVAGVFVDLRRVVRAGMRTSAGSLGLKALEPLHMGQRTGTVASAVDSMGQYQDYLDLLSSSGSVSDALRVRDDVIAYNRADCESTRSLRDWLVRSVGTRSTYTDRQGGIPDPSPAAEERVQIGGRSPAPRPGAGTTGRWGTQPPQMTAWGDPGRIEPVDLQSVMKNSYMDYAMSVIVSRALPDVRDGLKPVHRRVIYAMHDGGYRPDRGYFKCARVVGDVMGKYHPHGDSAIYDTLVRLAQPWSLRYPLVDGQGNFGSPGNDPAAAMRYTESRMAGLAMEMVRDIDEETVDFIPSYDGKTAEPVVLPARFPNLLVNGSAGIAVGMATNIPPHNLREVAEGAKWALEHPEATREELLAALIERIKGPDFPTSGLIVGKRGIDEAYRTGRGSIIMRAVVDVEEDRRGRLLLVVKELPYQVNPDNLLLKIAELVGDGKLTGIADVRDDSSSRTGMRLIIELKSDAVAQVVLNNLYKHTQMQDTFGANMLALVDGVPRTLRLDQFVSHWITHQVEVIQRRTRFRLRKAQERAHILLGYLKALDAIDEVIALIRRSPTVDDARTGLMELLDIYEVQATAILDLQLRRLAALERQKIIDEFNELQTKIADYQDLLASPERQRTIIRDELTVIVDEFGDDRRASFSPEEVDDFSRWLDL